MFDSGVGGLSILEAINLQLPQVNKLYLADNIAAPYGNKSNHWLLNRIISILQHFTSEHKLDAIVIACNTASTLSLTQLREKLDIPVIGVVPAIKTAAKQSSNHSIGVLATPTTIKGEYLKTLQKAFAQGKTVTHVGTTELVGIAEDKLSGKTLHLDEIKQIIQPFITQECDQVVLGCTHFPLLINELNTIAPNIHWIDSAHAVATQCKRILSNLFSAQLTPHPKAKQYFFSTTCISEDLRYTLKKRGFTSFKVINHNTDLVTYS